MRVDRYSHLECDVSGCQLKLDAPEDDIGNYGWSVGERYLTADGVARTFDLCPEHSYSFGQLRKEQDAAVDAFVSGDGK